MVSDDQDAEILLARFNKLIQELLRGSMTRNCFRPWEIELLLDIEACDLRESNKRELLRRYQKAVQRQMEKGASRPLLLSQYLEAQRLRKAARTADATPAQLQAAGR